jgi:hypothetical protein
VHDMTLRVNNQQEESDSDSEMPPPNRKPHEMVDSTSHSVSHEAPSVSCM